MKTAVISGGAGGLGRALAAQLQQRGWYTILLDLNVSDLATTERQLPIECDLTDPLDMDKTIRQIARQNRTIDLVIYNAGVTQIGAFEDTSEEALRRVFEVNFFSATALARAMLIPVREASGIHLVISSVAGFAPLYHRTCYAASKHALEGFFKSLRSEEALHGVRCQIAAPSFVATNLGNTKEQGSGLRRPGSAPDGFDVMSPGDAAREILKGLDRGVPMIPVGRVARLAWWMNGLCPQLFQSRMERRLRRK